MRKKRRDVHCVITGETRAQGAGRNGWSIKPDYHVYFTLIFGMKYMASLSLSLSYFPLFLFLILLYLPSPAPSFLISALYPSFCPALLHFSLSLSRLFTEPAFCSLTSKADRRKGQNRNKDKHITGSVKADYQALVRLQLISVIRHELFPPIRTERDRGEALPLMNRLPATE